MQSSGTKRSSASVEISETMLEAQISAPFPRMAHTLMEGRGIIPWWALGGDGVLGKGWLVGTGADSPMVDGSEGIRAGSTVRSRKRMGQGLSLKEKIFHSNPVNSPYKTTGFLGC